MFICEKCGAGKQRLHDVIFVKRLQGPAATLPERLGLVAPGFGVCGCPGTQFIREICVRQTNPTPRACLSHGTECRMPTDQSLWEQMLLAEQQLHSDPVHTLPVCSGLPGGYYVPNRVMTAPLPPLLPTAAAALRGGCTGARLAVCLWVLIVSFGALQAEGRLCPVFNVECSPVQGLAHAVDMCWRGKTQQMALPELAESTGEGAVSILTEVCRHPPVPSQVFLGGALEGQREDSACLFTSPLVQPPFITITDTLQTSLGKRQASAQE
ncbi:hypothetical protein Anapl_01867 [Anas platyrhynchos]|uniref:Uncharacterized protein n=1 Tax=Anas platyrhynchos TaxID=8839 RepID=R0LSE2_ANAPL|nr:hypothetical protein Anapl_01867 [Anas platyrhynchos]